MPLMVLLMARTVPMVVTALTALMAQICGGYVAQDMSEEPSLSGGFFLLVFFPNQALDPYQAGAAFPFAAGVPPGGPGTSRLSIKLELREVAI